MSRGFTFKKQVSIEDAGSAWIRTDKTIFDDRTQDSDYSLQQLAALEPSKRTINADTEQDAREVSDESSNVGEAGSDVGGAGSDVGEAGDPSDANDPSAVWLDSETAITHLITRYAGKWMPTGANYPLDTEDATSQPRQPWPKALRLHSIGLDALEDDFGYQLGASLEDRFEKTHTPEKVASQDQVEEPDMEDSRPSRHHNMELRRFDPGSNIVGLDGEVNASDSETSGNSGPWATEVPWIRDQSIEGDLESTTKDYLIQMIRNLAAENNQLRGANGKTQIPTKTKAATIWRTMYRVGRTTFLEQPSWSSDDSGVFTLRSHAPVSSTAGYLKRHEEIAFVEFKYFELGATLPASAQWGDDETIPEPQPVKESVKLTSPAMLDAMSTFLPKLPQFSKYFPDFDVAAELPAPYLFWYHNRDNVDASIKKLTGEKKYLVELFKTWIERVYGSEWQYIDSQLVQGLVSPISMRYLIRPQDVLVTSKNGIVEAFMVKECPKLQSPRLDESALDELQGRAKPVAKASSATLGDDSGVSSSASSKVEYIWTVESRNWSFNGSFRQAVRVLNLKIIAASPQDTVLVTSMDAYPLQFGDEELKELLRTRGQRFWKCRKRLLVSYADPNRNEMTIGGERYMVDVATYHHYRRSKEKEKSLSSYRSQTDEIEDPPASTTRLDDDGYAQAGPAKFDWDVFPDCPELFVFPRTIVAYDLRRKTWTDLDVDRIRDVSWDRKAFDSLAIDDDSKELIQALITKQIVASKNTDLIADKGSGLIMLLHGGPGTGKTFTAEGIADFARKPLYRVTCGDIGTNPEQVETYLESVLHLGLIWDCVVLLDEADVFLEERSQADLARNALVSVFLRILEYYQGILILTSNRVGSFDEAFKSRIQLALHYEDLTIAQRRKIWRNFIDRLKTLGETNVDYDDLNDHIDNLVSHEMNGRQIRNVITSARQLAQYRGQKMRYSHLEHVINVSGRFETYIREVKAGLSDATLKRMGGQR